VPNHAALAPVFGTVMEGLRAKGYGRSEFELDYAKSLSSSASLVGGVAVRYNADVAHAESGRMSGTQLIK
jgi:hypothetical protein